MVLRALHAFCHDCGLEQTLLDIIKLRVSQIYGCAHCIDMHTKELRAMASACSHRLISDLLVFTDDH
jgi:AhpD family alkylhydroperoxidase